MIVEVQATINGSRVASRAAITNIEKASETVSGIQRIEVLEKRRLRIPSHPEYFGEQRRHHVDQLSWFLPQAFVGKLMSIPMGSFFKGVAKKALRQDLNDIKSAVERK